MQQDAASVPKPRICLWCSSTNTFAAQRCIFCGMDLGQELQRARMQQPVSPEPLLPARGAGGVRRARSILLLLVPAAVLACLVLLHLAGTIL